MKVRKIENNSIEDVELKHKNGANTTLPPGVSLSEVDIINLEEVKGRTKTTIDLTEVNEHRGRTKLYG